MQLVIRTDADDVDSRLAELGLSRAVLEEPVAQGVMARSECTPNDPPLFPGISVWARTVRSLREKLIPVPFGWSRCDEGNYPLCVSPDGKLAIAVATGDENTGNPNVMPMTKSPKGPRTQNAISVNQYNGQGNLFETLPEFDPEVLLNKDRVTWILLQHFDQVRREVRFELSLPTSYSGRIDGWSERIIFGAISTDPSQVIPVPTLPNLPDIDVPLRRRA
jgi:hypothetical protein